MSAVVLILALAAAIVMSNLAGQRSSQRQREFRIGLRRIVADARESAVIARSDRLLRYDATGRRLEIVAPADDTAGTTEETLRTLALPEGIALQAFRSGETEASESDWQVRFYPDGTSDGGGLELTEGALELALTIDRRGGSALIEGALPETIEEQWQAGDHEQRL